MENELKEFGLSEKEIQVYLINLKLGPTTAGKISEISNIRRSTVYEVIETLKKKSLIKFFKKDKKTFFEAAKPKDLINLLKEKERLIESILPELSSLMNKSFEKLQAVVYEGKKGIKVASNEMLEEDEILIYGASKQGELLIDAFPENFARKRLEKKVKVRAILGRDVPEYMLRGEISKYTRVKINKSFTNHKTGYFIYGDNILIINLENELSAIKIKSKLMAESQRKIFEELWK